MTGEYYIEKKCINCNNYAPCIVFGDIIDKWICTLNKPFDNDCSGFELAERVKKYIELNDSQEVVLSSEEVKTLKKGDV